MPANIKLRARANETFEWAREVKLPGEEFPITDIVWDMHIRREPRSTDIVLAFASADGSITVAESDDETETVKLSIVRPLSAVQALDGHYYYDLRMTRGTRMSILIEGEIDFVPGVTRS